MVKGRTAVVAGSTSGIGLGIARALAAAGANVMLNGFGEASAIASGPIRGQLGCRERSLRCEPRRERKGHKGPESSLANSCRGARNGNWFSGALPGGARCKGIKISQLGTDP